MPETAIDTKTETQLTTPWNVVVHNDPVNLMSYVTMVFQKVFGYSRDRATKHMLEVHHLGRSIVERRPRTGRTICPAAAWLLLQATLEKSEGC